MSDFVGPGVVAMLDPLGGALPRCAVCNRPVGRLTRYYDMTCCKTVFVAHCHGQKETVELSDELIESGAGIGMGEAFATKGLPGEPRRLAASPQLDVGEE